MAVAAKGESVRSRCAQRKRERGRSAVSRLSPAIRHHLITESDVVIAVLRAHAFCRLGKFIQEVYWRRYWKSWLSLRPDAWSELLHDLDAIGENPAVRRIEESQSGNRAIDHLPTSW